MGPLCLSPDGLTCYRAETLAEICHEGHLHTHNYPHETRCVAGSVDVITLNPDGTERPPIRITAGTPNDRATVAAECKHMIKAVEAPALYECHFFHRDWDGTVIQKYNGNRRAYS